MNLPRYFAIASLLGLLGGCGTLTPTQQATISTEATTANQKVQNGASLVCTAATFASDLAGAATNAVGSGLQWLGKGAALVNSTAASAAPAPSTVSAPGK